MIAEVRTLNVLVLHPRDSDCDDLMQQVVRIGCKVETLWPVPESLPTNVDVVFIEIREAISPALARLFLQRLERRPTVIGIIGYENPSVMQCMLNLDVHAVISKPLRAFGVLSCILLARRVWQTQIDSFKTEEKLKLKLENIQKITEAKFILMRLHTINDQDAYKIIRSHAMSRRTSTIEIANAIINADGLLSNLNVKK
ncbi:AmiR/NasT family two-component response regulator [Roseinatronobacter monicus]|uniref:AmiR/NasT family two-component response regulator n=2 Tax=Roseinatronobacter monicus TaxID=393481 RepID=A0A543K4T3_9RHOB|nr:AmiR/NasT family two-component response regulator [Roseinatronobacter monicus]